jgi:hypothetical protein
LKRKAKFFHGAHLFLRRAFLSLAKTIEASIYYDSSQRYPGQALDEILQQFLKLGSTHVRVKQTDRAELKSEDEIVEDIRSIQPQWRGSVVSSGGKALPISGSKKLNLQNTPVILVRESKKPVYVFPCKIGERYYSVLNGISFLKENLPTIAKLEGQMEDSLVNLVLHAPEQLEDELTPYDLDVDTPTGKTDVVFKDREGKFLVVEVEREATDSAVGQILRLSAGFERHHQLGSKDVRSGIVCYRIHPNVLAACQRADITVWKYDQKSERFFRVHQS